MIRKADRVPELVSESLDGLRRYRVTGPQFVHNTAPGETFMAVLDQGQEDFLVSVGHIEIVRPAPDIKGAPKQHAQIRSTDDG